LQFVHLFCNQSKCILLFFSCISSLHSGGDKDEKCIQNYICELLNKREFEETRFRWENDLKMEYMLKVPEANLENADNWKRGIIILKGLCSR
jgi:hypothetical protein